MFAGDRSLLTMNQIADVSDAIAAVAVMECSMQAAALLGAISPLHSSFPDDPDAEYDNHADVSICKLLSHYANFCHIMQTAVSFSNIPSLVNPPFHLRYTRQERLILQKLGLSHLATTAARVSSVAQPPSPLSQSAAPAAITQTDIAALQLRGTPSNTFLIVQPAHTLSGAVTTSPRRVSSPPWPTPSPLSDEQRLIAMNNRAPMAAHDVHSELPIVSDQRRDDEEAFLLELKAALVVHLRTADPATTTPKVPATP